MSQWKLTELAQQEIDSLVNDGVNLRPIDIIRIHRLAKDVETPETQKQLARGVPVPLGNVYLYPLTLAASSFLTECEPYCKDSEQLYLLAFAMCFGGDSEAMATVGKQGVKNAVKWAKRLPVTIREMVQAVETVQGDEIPIDDPLQKNSGMTLGELSSTLCALVGGAPEVWEKQCSIAYCCDVLSTILRNNQADDRPSINDPRIKAERRLGLYVEGLRKRHRQQTQKQEK